MYVVNHVNTTVEWFPITQFILFFFTSLKFTYHIKNYKFTVQKRKKKKLNNKLPNYNF